MGSFHSEDVDEFVTLSDDEYRPPPLPFEDDDNTTVDGTIDTDSGYVDESVRNNDAFLLDFDNWTFLNHGAFGASLKVSYGRAQRWRRYLERQPLRYFDRDLLPHMAYGCRRMRDFVNAGRDTTTLIPNVTYGLNAVLGGYAREYQGNCNNSAPKIVLWDTSYGSLKKMARMYVGQENVVEIPVSNYFHMWKDEPAADVFELAFRDTMTEIRTAGKQQQHDGDAKILLVLDHTTSNTALNMPFQLLAHLAKGDEYGESDNTLVLVDGAHGLLAQRVDLSNGGSDGDGDVVDFYVGNGHKWLSCPRGVGMMYCSSQQLRDTVLRRPPCASHGVDLGYQNRYLWDGCRDYAAALSVATAIDFWERRGSERTRAELKTKLEDAVELLGDAWRPPSLLQNIDYRATLAPLQFHSPMMALVRLPDKLQRRQGKEAASTSTDAKRLQDYLYDRRIEVPIKCVRGELFVRISCHVYNQLKEYRRLADAVNEIC